MILFIFNALVFVDALLGVVDALLVVEGVIVEGVIVETVIVEGVIVQDVTVEGVKPLSKS